MRILLATDGTENAEEAVKSIAHRPWPEGSEVKIVSVAELVLPGDEVTAASSSVVYPMSLLEQIWEDARVRAREAVERARRILVTQGMRAEREEAVLDGDPRIILLEQAKEWNADLLVLGSHGRRGIDHVLMGSVSETVALHAPCSVEIFRERRGTQSKTTNWSAEVGTRADS